MSTPPEHRDGHPVWRDVLDRPRARVRLGFVGRGGGSARPSREELLRLAEARAPSLAWARQVHSAKVLEARPGICGEGDALTTELPDLALSVVTADCVPVLLASGGENGGFHLAAVHAGWRGIVAGVVSAAVQHLAGRGPSPVAWIGPAIGPCCYEVGDEVARQVAAASAGEVVLPNPAPDRPNPHLDLPAAVCLQLEAAGVETLHRVDACTRCHPGELASYRREGRGAGRNLSYIWWERR